MPHISVDTSEIGKNVLFAISATDPDNDSVTFRIDWSNGDTSEWCSFVPSGDTIAMNHSFHSKGTFYIKVQAKDIHEEISEWSEPDSIVIQDSAWTLIWTCITQSAPWSPRWGHTSLVFDNKIWVIGGIGTHPYSPATLSDVWFSTGGFNWACENESAPWLHRCSHASVVFDNKIWVIGGLAGSYYLNLDNEVWNSADGDSWTCATDSADWHPGRFHKSVVFEEKMWISGGDYFTAWGDKDVWNSSNGSKWIFATDSAEWPERFGHEFVVFENNMWILGGCAGYGRGEPSNDVWLSDNGSHWTCITDSAPWSRREYFVSVVFDNKIWVIGENTVVMD